MTPDLRPDSIIVRQRFLVLPTDDPHGPVLPKLIQSRGLQLKLELLLLFDAQCRYEPGRSVRNVRRVTARPDEDYLSWRQLVLTAASSHRRAADLRARQITEALRTLEEYDLLRIPRQPGGTRRIYGFGPDGKTTWQLQTEASNPDVHPDYLVPNPTRATFRIPREFFTNLWIFALTDTEIAAYLTLTFLRWRFPARHAEQGVYLLDRHRHDNFRLTRATWRATDFLHRFRLIDRAPSPGRDFRTGNIGDFNRRWANREVMPPPGVRTGLDVFARGAGQTTLHRGYNRAQWYPAEDLGPAHHGRADVAREADRLDIVVRAPTTTTARRPGMAGAGASSRWADC